MTISNNKHIIMNETLWIRQLFFSHITFLSLSEVSVVFNMSLTYATANLGKRRSSQEQCLITKYLSFFQILLYSQLHILGFHI